MNTTNKEIRSVNYEIRTDRESRTVEGYGVVFESPSVDLGFTETIHRGAITQETIDTSDVFCRFNHDNNKILARSKKGKGSLELSIDDTGVKYRFQAPKTALGDELLEYLEREELRYVYENASLFVTTSLNEGFGNTPIEAAFYHCPVICSRCDSLPEVTMGLVDYYEPAMDENCLSEVIIETLSNPPSKARLRMVSDRFKEAYNSTKRVASFEKVFLSINK